MMMKKNYCYKVVLTTLGLCIWILSVSGKTRAEVQGVVFLSQFSNTPDRIWPGAEYWPNPMEDWRIHDGRLEVTQDGSNRNVHILTHELGTALGSFEINVLTGLLERGAKGSAGFRIGIRERSINDYRANVFFGEGLNAGITVDGRLFLVEESITLNRHSDLENIHLKLTGSPVPNSTFFSLTLTAFDMAENVEIGIITLNDIRPLDLVGNIALVNNHTGEGSRFWFNNWQITGPRIAYFPERAFGPILWSMYTLSNSRNNDGYILNIQAQMPPLGKDDSNLVALETYRNNRWEYVGEGKIHPYARNAVIEVKNWPADEDVPFRLVYETPNTEGTIIRDEWGGTIRRNPVDQDKFTLVSMNCLHGQYFPHKPVSDNVKKLNPDMLSFHGDQLYEPDGGYGVIRYPEQEGMDRAMINYLRKYYMFGWSFRDVMRDRPTIVMPDDHDVFQGNLWGEGGAAGEADPQNPVSWSDSGGYYMPVDWVNMVHRSQMAHHPPFFNPKPTYRGITVYYGDKVYGGLSFAMISDRMFKSSPRRVVTDADRHDLVTDPDWDMDALDIPGLELLGDRQMTFLEHWVQDWRGGVEMKVLLSQSPFANINTHHSHNFIRYYADLDGHGWPQTARNEAIALLQKAAPLHVSGDQHLTSLIKYGINDFGDAFWGFCPPAVGTGWPRWWLPDTSDMPRYGESSHNLPNTGDYYDGTGHPIHVHAVGNPTNMRGATRYEEAHHKASGFGAMIFNKRTREIEIRSYRHNIDIDHPADNKLFPGWPKTIHQLENLGGKPVAYLPAVTFSGELRPVIRVIDETTGELVYMIRSPSASFKPPVFSVSTYTVEIGNPDNNEWEVHRNQHIINR